MCSTVAFEAKEKGNINGDEVDMLIISEFTPTSFLQVEAKLLWLLVLLFG